MGGVNQYRHSSGKRVNVLICGGFPSFHQNLCTNQVNGTMVIGLRDKKKKKNNMDKMHKLIFLIIRTISCNLV